MNEDDGRAKPKYAGTFPGHYTFHQPLRQWQPQLTRELRIAPAAPETNLADFPWDSVDVKAFTHRRPEEWWQLTKRLGDLGWNMKIYHLNEGESDSSQKARQSIPHSLSQFQDSDNAFWAAAFSPSGRGDLLDLPLLDPTDRNEWLFVAVKTTAQTRYIVRRLYRTDD
jgi:hypothetical protein